MNTGEDDIYTTANIRSWEGLNVLTTWPKNDEEDYCNQITGTDSSYYRPFLTPDAENLWVFNTDICR